MRGTKWFCIILGSFLVVSTFVLAPYGLVLKSALSKGIQPKVGQMIEDGSLTVNAQELAAKHGTDQGGLASFEHPEDAKTAAILIIVWSANDAVRGMGFTISCAQLVMGVLWLAVGISIPAKLPTAPL